MSFNDRSMIISNGTNQLTCKRDLRSGPGGMFYSRELCGNSCPMTCHQKRLSQANQSRREDWLKMSHQENLNGRGRNTIKVDINEAHELLGHVGIKSLKETAKLYDWDLSENLKSVSDASKRRLRQNLVAKTTITKA